MRKNPKVSVPCGSNGPWRWSHLVSKFSIQVTCCRDNLRRLYTFTSEMKKQLRTEAPLWRIGSSISLDVRKIKILKAAMLTPNSFKKKGPVACFQGLQDSEGWGSPSYWVVEGIFEEEEVWAMCLCFYKNAAENRDPAVETPVSREEPEGFFETWCLGMTRVGNKRRMASSAEGQSDQRLNTSYPEIPCLITSQGNNHRFMQDLSWIAWMI